MNCKKIVGLILAASLGIGAGTSAFAADVSVDEITSDEAVETLDLIKISNDEISTENYKDIRYNNPVSSQFFCADPTSVEYEGRLYLFGTNDHQQYEAKGPDEENTYEQIKSLVVLSTDDMVNWIYHGEINVGEVAPWIMNSWAPTITSRVEEDGKTHFYLYFSNNGTGVGVITATDPLGPWEDPLGKPFISTSTPGLKNCPNPFDPGVVIDENGVGWLSFGAGKEPGGTDYMPGSARIVKLGEDMLSFDSDFVEIPAPYLFEASELNCFGDTYVYTYNNDWTDHTEQWDFDCDPPSQCSMAYMTTKTPLDPDSWEMQGEYFKNPGTAGFDYSNNHTHLHKFRGEYYIFYHTQMLRRGMGIDGGYRSLGVDKIAVDEENVVFERIGGTKKGVKSIKAVDPFTTNLAAQLNNTADITYDLTDNSKPIVISDGKGAWFSVRDVEFTESEVSDEPDEPVEFELTAIDTIKYDITVTSVDKETTISMYPSTKDGVNRTGTVDVAKAGKYSITCDIEGNEMLQNMGYFKASDDAEITFIIETMTINDKYVFDMSVELTNTREWADGLKNIWNGFSDGDEVYGSDFASFKYIKEDDAIEFFASPNISSGNDADNAPLLEDPVTFVGSVMGSGRIEVRLDSPTGDLLTSIEFDSEDAFQNVYNKDVAAVGGTRDLYFVFSDESISLESWRFEKSEAPDTSEPDDSKPGTTEVLYGDADNDGKVDILDIIVLNRNLLGGGELSEEGRVNADVDLDGKPSANDSLNILKFLVKLIDKLPV